MNTRKSSSRQLATAPSYAHFHVYERFPSGLHASHKIATTTEARETMKMYRETSNDGFPRYVAWCTCP